MATWRAIHSKISTSWDVSQLSEFGELLFDRLILHADDWGILTAQAGALKLKCIPGRPERTLEDVEAALEDMDRIGLISLYEPEGCGALLWVRKFDDYQPKVLIGNRTAPKLPLHPDHPQFNEFTAVSREPLESPPRQEEKEEKEKEEKDQKAAVPFSVIFTHETDVFVGTGAQADEIDAWMEDVPEEWFRAACKEALDHNARNWAYVRAILDRWKREGKGGAHKRGLGPDDIDYDAEAERRQADD